MRAAIYARYSSDNQRDASIEDQLQQCQNHATAEGWDLEETYTDRAMSGASALRPDYQRMLLDARAGQFDVLIAEALDRLSRDQEDIAALFKQLSFAGIKLITLAEGEINELHVGLKGTMNALFLKDLAQKTRRGLEGRIRQGKSGGGNAFGYSVVHKLTTDGTPIRGDRHINFEEAGVIKRIFREFAAGRSPRAIAHDLNADGVAGPRDKAWGPSTIHGNWRRGTGILNNELYIGRLVWNRQRFIKDPTTGKRQARLNPEDQWIAQEVPALRIIDNDLWQQVKDRQRTTRRQIAEDRDIRSERARRPRYLLSGLLQCGACGGGFSKISQNHYGCSTARNKGTCSNLLTIRRDVIEHAVLSGLQNQLMRPDAYEAFVHEFNHEYNRIAAMEDIERERLERELKQIEADISRIIEAIKAGIPGDAVKDEIEKLTKEKDCKSAELNAIPSSKPRLHPNLSKIYREKVENLVNTLNEPTALSEATEAIRSLVETVRLVPNEGELKIELYGELAALLTLGTAPKYKHPRDKSSGVQVTLVAGARFVEAPTTCRAV